MEVAKGKAQFTGPGGGFRKRLSVVVGGRKVNSSPNRLAVFLTQSAFPYGRPRTTLRRMASSSSSACGCLTKSTQARG